MKKILIFLFILDLAGTTLGQGVGKVIIDNSSDYFVKGENETYMSRYIDTTTDAIIVDTVKANLIVNFDPRRGDSGQIVINSTAAKLHGDTLDLRIYHSAYEIVWEYKILIIRSTYNIEAWFESPISRGENKIEIESSSLTINTMTFKPGQLLKGHTRLKGQCAGNHCFSKDIIIDGNFRVLIK